MQVQLRQVEFNTMSCGLLSYTEVVSRMHRYLHVVSGDDGDVEVSLPRNDGNHEAFARGLADAHRLYGVEK